MSEVGAEGRTRQGSDGDLASQDLPRAGNRPIRVLLIEDNPADARLVEIALAESRTARFDLVWVDRLSVARRRLGEEEFDVIVLDLSLPDSYGIQSLRDLKADVHGLPIVILTGLDDEALGVEAVKQSAQDFLVKGQFGGDALARTLRYAVERSRAQKRLDQMRSDFVAMLSHDIKNPLTAVLGFVNLLRRRPPRDPEELRADLDRIEVGARTALALAVNFVDAARIESGPLRLETRPASLNEIAAKVLEQHESMARVNRIIFETAFAGDLPQLQLDRRLIDRAVANLVSNAVKFSPEESRVRIATGRDGDCAVLSVRDHGPGIPAEDRPKLFGRFSLLASPRRDSTGLGLFIVRTIAEAHGGNVRFDCPPDGGSVFELRLPLQGASK